MKVLILTNYGMGLYKFRKELMQRFLSEKYEVCVSFPADEYSPKIEKMGCSFIDAPLERRGINPIKDINLLLFYLHLIKNQKPDIILTYTIKPNIYGGLASRICKVPYISNITGLGTAFEKKGLFKIFIKKLYKFGLKNSMCVFFQNLNNRELFFANNIYTGNSVLIPGSGVNLKDFIYQQYPDDSLVNFVFVSRIMQQKGIEQYLKAAEEITAKYDNVVFNVVGFCEERYEEILNTMHENKKIVYHGIQENVKDFYKNCHCIIHPSYYPEGLSNVLLEASATGRPIITTNMPGCKEVVENGKNGFLIEPQNTKDLIDKIEVFMNLDNCRRRLMGLHSRRKVEKEYDRNIVINAYIEEINNILGESK